MKKSIKFQKTNSTQSTFPSKAMYILKTILLFLLSSLIFSCTLINLKKEVKTIFDSSILVGYVSSTFLWKKPVVVVAYSKNQDKREIAHYAVLHETGSYELAVPKGDYYVFAFGDKNKNLIYEADEPAGQYGNPDVISTPTGGVVHNINIVISNRKNTSVDFPLNSAISHIRPKKLHSTLAGAIADLDDEVFSDEYGAKGFWEPMEFFKEVGGNIYFLEEYDSAKIPILFVHGMRASPQRWKYFFENIDRSRYQPWFFNYPSGAPSKSMAHLLHKKLLDLQLKYHFKRLYITGHSLGGLIIRSFILDHGKSHPYIKLFISISTPWGGEALAEFGVKLLPSVMPSLKDLQPEGEFINSLFHRKIPPEIDYYLFFAHKGNRSLIRPNNDGVVTLASQLDLRSQSEAKRIYGFDEYHSSILSSKDVLDQYNAILASTDKGLGDYFTHAGGDLLVHFSFEISDENPRPNPILLLKPVNQDQNETLLYLNPDESGQEFGPIPPGDYNVSMIAYAFKTEPAKVPVTIESGKIPSVNFLFTPQGVLSGYVAKKPDTDEYPVGMYLPPGENVKIRSVTLTGGNLRRELSPLKGEEVNYYDHYLSGKDYAHKAGFSFFDLPPGEYELQIKAEGYEIYTKKSSVVPGKFGNFRVTELTPLEYIVSH